MVSTIYDKEDCVSVLALLFLFRNIVFFFCRLKEQEEQKLREAEKKRNSPPRNSPAHRGYDPVGQPHPRHLTPVNEDEENIDSRISKLIEERDTLLQTGAFKTEDRIIVELDKQIRDAIASKG